MPIEFPGSDYIKRFNDYFQPFSSQNLPYTATALVGLATLGAIGGGLFLYNRNKKSKFSLAGATTLAKVDNILKNVSRQVISSGTYQEKLAEHSKLYGEKIDKEKLFAQINKDLLRNQLGKIELRVNGTLYDGSDQKKAANILAHIYQLLNMKEGQDEAMDQRILAILTLLQQGVFAQTQKGILETLKVLENGFNLESRSLDPKCFHCGEYRLEVIGQNITLTCWRYSVLKAINSGTNPLFREEPYAIFKESIKLDFAKQKIEESWKIT